MIRIEDVQGKWKHRKTGKIVEVQTMRGDSFGIRHASGRQTYKAVHYFIEDYERVPWLEQSKEARPGEKTFSCPRISTPEHF